MLFTKSEHTVSQVVALSYPVPAVYARNAWDHDPSFGDKERLAFEDSGFPAGARVKSVTQYRRTQSNSERHIECGSSALDLKMPNEKSMTAF